MKHRLMRVITPLVCVAAVIASATLAYGQVTSSLSGTVTDTTGAVLPGADIVAKSDDTGATFTAVSGANGTPHFTGPALWRIYHYSQGIPRLVNAICDKALLAGFVGQRDNIDFRTVGHAARELEGNINS